MKKLLYIGQCINSTSSGADHVNKRNQQLLEGIFKKQITYISPSTTGFVDKLTLGINNRVIDAVKSELVRGDYTHVFIAQSLLGRVAEFVKLNFPMLEVITFFHNIELQYAQEYLKTKRLRAMPFYLTVKYWEQKCCKYSDKFITLNKRDSKLLKQIYGKDSSLELPTSFNDVFSEERALKSFENKGIDTISVDYLFVGVAFFANVQGVQWFIDNVMPELNGNFFVVGNGMDKVPFKNLTSNIYVYGFVDDLADFYYRAKVVVSPIFVGGGMKTKTAEALMYGKTIVGTKEAFEGYEIDKRSMYLCSTPKDFVKVISSLNREQYFNPFSRELYKNLYSTDVAYLKLKGLFK